MTKRHWKAIRPIIVAKILFVVTLMPGWSQAAVPQSGDIPLKIWSSYVASFVTAQGRVVDNANGNISHSESQGYGLLLAYLSGDQTTFDQIWSFTKTNMWLRDDDLVVWKWDPAASAHVQDLNNATDGDILIAYSLALAAKAWNRPDLEMAARRIAKAISSKLVFTRDGLWLLKPAASGFSQDDRQDGPVINLSYWVFEAFPVLAELTQEARWNALSESGLKLVREARFGPDRLPSDWISLEQSAAPAGGFPAEFGFNAIRIPLYLVRSAHEASDLLAPFEHAMIEHPSVINVLTGQRTEKLTDPGYKSIGAALACIQEGKPIPDEVKSFTPTFYYPSTLHLLVLSFLSQKHPECL